MADFKLTKAEYAALQKLLSEYEEARADLSLWLDDRATEWETALEEKSDKWREGEAGQAAEERTDTVRAWFDRFPDQSEIDPDSLL